MPTTVSTRRLKLGQFNLDEAVEPAIDKVVGH